MTYKVAPERYLSASWEKQSEKVLNIIMNIGYSSTKYKTDLYLLIE